MIWFRSTKARRKASIFALFAALLSSVQPAFAGTYALGFKGADKYQELALRLTAGAEPQSVPYGTGTTLSWSAPQAQHVYLNGAEVAASGTQNVSPLQSTTYHFSVVATSGMQGADKDVTVSVIQPDSAIVDSFVANPATVTLGSSLTLQWATERAATVSLQGEGLDSSGSYTLNGSKVITPVTVGSHEYRINAANVKGEVTSQVVEVTVVAAPVFGGAQFDHNSIRLGETAALSWSASGASKVTISGGSLDAAVSRPVNGSIQITPSTVGVENYTLSAFNSLGDSVQAHASLTTSYALPTLSLQADKAQVAVGDPISLSWTGTSLSNVTYHGDNSTHPSSGSLQVTAGAVGNHSYAFTGNGLDGSTVDKSVSVNVAALPTVSATFTGTSVSVGQSATLNWTGNSAVDHVRVTGAGAPSGDQPASGSASISIATSGANSYTVTAYDTLGHQASSTASITGINVASLTGASVSPAQFTVGDAASISWTGTSVDHVTVSGPQYSGAPSGDLSGNSAAINPSIAGTYTYTVQAFNAKGDAGQSQTATATVYGLPVLAPLVANRSTITLGQGYTIHTTGGAQHAALSSITISGPAGSGAPGAGVTPAATLSWTPTSAGSYTYTVTGYNAIGAASAPQTLDVTVVPVSTMTSAAVSSTSISTGDSVTLSWVGTNLSKVDISGAGLSLTNQTTSPTGGSATVTPTANGAITVKGYNANNTTGGTASTNAITIYDLPILGTLNASATSITLGSSFTLQQAQAGSNVSISAVKISGTAGSGASNSDVAAASSYVVTPTQAGSYTYSVVGTSPVGRQTAAQTFTVDVVAPAAVATASVSSTTISTGDSVTVSWTGSSLSKVNISGAGVSVNNQTSSATGGSATVQPTTNGAITVTGVNSLNAAGTSANTQSVSVYPLPVLGTLNASTTSMTLGSSFTLQQAQAGSNVGLSTVNISSTTGSGAPNADVAVASSYSITPTQAGSFTYTVVGKNPAGRQSASQTFTVNVVGPATVTGASVSKSTITTGEAITLNWTGTGLSTVNISGAGLNLTGVASSTTSGSRSVIPTAAGAITVTGVNTIGATGGSSATGAVSIVAAPSVTGISANKTYNTLGGAITLSWAVSGASSLTVTGVGGSGAPGAIGTTATSVSVTPSVAGAYTYTVTATNAAGATSSQAVTVTTVAAPVVSGIVASPAYVTPGAASTISWSLGGSVSALNINGTALAANATSYTVYPGATTTFTVTATNQAGTISQQAVVVNVGNAPSLSVGIGPNGATLNQTVLSWSSSGATYLQYTNNGAVVGSQPASGSAVIAAVMSGNSYPITVTASNVYGSKTISVNCLYTGGTHQVTSNGSTYNYTVLGNNFANGVGQPYAWNGSWFAPGGLVGAASGNNTYSICGWAP